MIRCSFSHSLLCRGRNLWAETDSGAQFSCLGVQPWTTSGKGVPGGRRPHSGGHGGAVLRPSGPTPPSTFCEAASKRIWTLVLTNPRCLRPEGRGPQTQKESGLQHAGQRAHGRPTRKGDDWAVRALTQAEGTVQLSGWCGAEGTDAHAETVRPPGLAPAPAPGLAKTAEDMATREISSGSTSTAARFTVSRQAARRHLLCSPSQQLPHPVPGQPTPDVAGECHTERPEGRPPSTPSAHG